MSQTFEAIYEDGVLKPVAPLDLKEHQRVQITVLGEPGEREPLRFVDPAEFRHLADPSITLEMVHEALSGIKGSMDADFYAEREERF